MKKIDTRVAFPTNDGQTVSEHFGHCRMFALADIADGQITAMNSIEAPEHAPGVFPRFLGEQGANVIITGGMGKTAVDMFKARSIEVILGASGSIQDNLNEFLNGGLYSSGSVCDHSHDHDHDHSQHGR